MKIIYGRLFSLLILFASSGCTKDSAGVKTVAGTGGSLARFTISGNYLYAIDNQRINSFSLTDPTAPALQSSVLVGQDIETIFPFKGNLFIGSTSVVYIYSLSDPAHPAKLSTASVDAPHSFRHCDPIVARDSVAYSTLKSSTPCGGTQSILAVYDIKEVTSPLLLSTYPLGEPAGLGYSDSALYVCDQSSLMVFNISDPFNPVFSKAVDGQGNELIDVIPYDNILMCWVKTGMILYDITDRMDPKFVAKIF